MTEAALQAIDICKNFRQGPELLQVLTGASLHIAAGERLAIVGASGSGKTTLLQILGGLDKPTSGAVLIGGRDIHQMGERDRGRLRNQALGFVYQFHHLLPSSRRSRMSRCRCWCDALPSPRRANARARSWNGSDSGSG